jgi:uncharacterized protein YndB with AHSA1/START domain
MRGGDPVLTSTFRLLTAACPDRVWGVLTCPEAAPRYLHGLSPKTCWSNGAPVEWQTAGVAPIPGQVLHVDPPYRLSITVEDDSGVSTYLTWTLRAADAGTVVTLRVDEADPRGGSETDLEDVWLPVLDRLGALLQEEQRS